MSALHTVIYKTLNTLLYIRPRNTVYSNCGYSNYISALESSNRCVVFLPELSVIRVICLQQIWIRERGKVRMGGRVCGGGKICIVVEVEEDSEEGEDMHKVESKIYQMKLVMNTMWWTTNWIESLSKSQQITQWHHKFWKPYKSILKSFYWINYIRHIQSLGTMVFTSFF